MSQGINLIPHNLEAEQAVIGGLLLDAESERASAVLNLLKSESFYHQAHKLIFREIQSLVAQRQPVDLLTLEKRLNDIGVSHELGGFAYLAELAKNTPSVANIYAYACIVRDEAVKRFAVLKLQECERLLCENSRLSAEERLEVIGRLMNEIADHSRTGKTQGLRSAREISAQWLDDYERYHREPDAVAGLRTGIETLDNLIGARGMAKQSLVVVGARPKCGKTAFYALIANQCVTVARKTALLFSLEMSGKQIFERLIAQRMHLNTATLYDRQAQRQHQVDEAFAKLSEGMAALVDEDLLLIDDTPNVSLAHIRQECRRIKRERGEIGLIAVDYLTLMKAEKAERNDLAYGEITKGLKTLAREMDCVVLLLTQLNRNLENRADKRPLPNDSRDTGQIEQECDLWFGLYKESVYNSEADPHLTEIHLRLNRNGQTGMAYADQRFGAMFPCDPQEAAQRAQKGKAEVKTSKKIHRGDI